MRRLLWAMLLSTASAAQAQDAKALQAASLAASCSACHGTEGRAVAGAAVPGLAGLQASRIAEQMKAFRGGARTGTVMPQIAKGYSDAQIEQLSAYFSTRK